MNQPQVPRPQSYKPGDIPRPAHVYQASRTGADETLSYVVPYRNKYALVSYYMGVFSLIPILGAPIGLGAFALGILGLLHARQHPEAHGRAHAIIGIVAGGLFGLAWVAVIVGVALMLVAEASRGV